MRHGRASRLGQLVPPRTQCRNVVDAREPIVGPGLLDLDRQAGTAVDCVDRLHICSQSDDGGEANHGPTRRGSRGLFCNEVFGEFSFVTLMANGMTKQP
eukprot:scaffold87629_cov90-Phaeocystis_antarctica.AAC.3